jgi:hypothetical protein
MLWKFGTLDETTKIRKDLECKGLSTGRFRRLELGMVCGVCEMNGKQRLRQDRRRVREVREAKAREAVRLTGEMEARGVRGGKWELMLAVRRGRSRK